MGETLIAATEALSRHPVLTANGDYQADGVLDAGQNWHTEAITGFDTSALASALHVKTLGEYLYLSHINASNQFEITQYRLSGNVVTKLGSKAWTTFYHPSGTRSMAATQVVDFVIESGGQVLTILYADAGILLNIYEYDSAAGTAWVSENTFRAHNDYSQVTQALARHDALVETTATGLTVYRVPDGVNHLTRFTRAPTRTSTLTLSAGITKALPNPEFTQVLIWKGAAYDVVDLSGTSLTAPNTSTTTGEIAALRTARCAVWLDDERLLAVGDTSASALTRMAAYVDIELTLISGGAGGGAGFANGDHFVGGGGGGSGEIQTRRLTLPAGTELTCAVGDGGVGGLSTGGGDGGNTSVTYTLAGKTTTITATGGRGASNGRGGTSGNGNIGTDRGISGTYRDGGDGGGDDGDDIGQRLDLEPFNGILDARTPNGYCAGGLGGSRLAGQSGDQTSTPGSNQADGSDAADHTGCGGGGGNNGGGTNALGAGGDGGSGLIAIRVLTRRDPSGSRNRHAGYTQRLVKSNGVVKI